MTTPPRPSGMFRGSEGPRLLLLLALMVGGWAVVAAAFFAQPKRPPSSSPAQPPPLPLPPADPAPELRGVVDGAPLSMRENPGYRLLLERVRTTPPADLMADARRDVVFSQLRENPARYRGIPIHVEGTARRVLFQPGEGSNVLPPGGVHEAYVFTPDSQMLPLILVFEQAPAGLPVGNNVDRYLTFDGYFFKVLRYRAGDARRVLTVDAPLLVGRVRYLAPPDQEEQSGSRGGWPVGFWWILGLGALILFGALRWVIFSRGVFRRGAVNIPHRPTIVSDHIEPDDLSHWLEEQSRPSDEDEGDHTPPASEERRP